MACWIARDLYQPVQAPDQRDAKEWSRIFPRKLVTGLINRFMKSPATPARVLMVEDDQGWLRIFQSTIAESTDDLFEFTYTRTLEEALQTLENGHFELVLLDLMLPGSAHTNTIQVMGSHSKRLPIIVLTTLEDEEVMRYCYSMGVEDYLVKDKYDRNLFIHVVRQAILRFVSDIQSDISRSLEELLKRLRATDATLEEWERKNLVLPGEV